MIKTIKNTYFILEFITILSYQTLKYLLIGKYDKRLEEIADYLANKNLLYIKVFQAISASTNIINKEFSNYLIKYSDNVPYKKEEIEIEKIIEDIEEIGKTWPEYKINKIDIIPYKSGSVSVVYDAKMNNKDVVIKVLRKNMDKKMKEALDQAKLIIKIISYFKIFNDINLDLILDENRVVLLDQVDFLKEVLNIEMFERSNKNRESYVIPHVYNEFTIKNKRIIVMDKLDGLRLDKISKEEKEEYILLITKFLIISIIFDGHYHGDLHQGNILFMRDNKKRAKIGIIDFGIVGKLLPKVQEDLYHFFIELLKNNYEKVGKAVLDSLIEDTNDEKKKVIIDKVKRKELINELSKIAEEAVREEGNIGPEEIKKINKILKEYELRLSSDFCKIVLAMAVSKCLCESLCAEDKKYVEYINKATNELVKDTLNILDI